jgi:hypothetical protein
MLFFQTSFQIFPAGWSPLSLLGLPAVRARGRKGEKFSFFLVAEMAKKRIAKV